MEKDIQDRLTQALDDALELTFPASDPIAVSVPRALDRNPEDT